MTFFQSCGHCWVFQICWHIECSTLAASSFRIWKSSAGISSPSPALFAVMLPKALLTWHSWMSGSRWVTAPSWLSGSLIPFLYKPYMYFCHFLISSASAGPCYWGFPSGSVVKKPSANVGDVDSIPGSGRSCGEGNSYLLHYSCLRNPKDRESGRP